MLLAAKRQRRNIRRFHKQPGRKSLVEYHISFKKRPNVCGNIMARLRVVQRKQQDIGRGRWWNPRRNHYRKLNVEKRCWLFMVLCQRLLHCSSNGPFSIRLHQGTSQLQRKSLKSTRKRSKFSQQCLKCLRGAGRRCLSGAFMKIQGRIYCASAALHFQRTLRYIVVQRCRLCLTMHRKCAVWFMFLLTKHLISVKRNIWSSVERFQFTLTLRIFQRTTLM